VLEGIAKGAPVLAFDDLIKTLNNGDAGALILTGNYPSEWATPELRAALGARGLNTTLIDTLASPLVGDADTVLPGATWTEKAGTFENDKHIMQSFEQAIDPIEMAKTEGQIALDLLHQLDKHEGAASKTSRAPLFNAANTRSEMAAIHPSELGAFLTDVRMPMVEAAHEPGMEIVEL
jgi:anaerobic selenocysteine-containing dehydrogenase